MSVIIGADIVPVDSNLTYFENGQIDLLLGNELLDILRNADFRVFNLEAPLTDALTPIQKHGPTLSASTSSSIGLKQMDINLLTLANNHILDQGIAGLKSTMQVLDDLKISHVGAGININDARQPYYFDVRGKKYGVYACAEHEFSIATKEKAGANPFDPLESLDHIMRLKSSCDYIIVLYHGGKEHYRYPSPNLQKVCRKLIEKGADLVICQHSHCIGCKEEYKHGTIVYGQGNFLFNYSDDDFWNTSLLVEIKDDNSLNYIPICKQKEGVRLSKESESKAILEEFESRSREIRNEEFIEKNYKAYAKKMRANYLLYFCGLNNNILFRILNRISGQRLRRFVTNKIIADRGVGLRNYIECEAHRELFLKGLEE